MFSRIPNSSHLHVAVIGGGVAGSTIMLRLAELGIRTTLFEKGNSLVSGPPMCHLHAGGNLYRDISDEQCLALLQQSIETMKLYSHCVDWRPTVIALPTSDKSTPEALLPRLHKLQMRYQDLVNEDETNAVLGAPADYFRVYERAQLETLAKSPTPEEAKSPDDWLIPVAKNLNLDAIQYPIFLVQEYGLSAFRVAATATLAMAALPACELRLQHRVTGASQIKAPSSERKQWQLTCEDLAGNQTQFEFDYVVNACGFRSGEIDDFLQLPRQRLVEFKAAYVTHWDARSGQWPEVIIHGERGTPQGMAQLTPYPEGYCQLHGMTPSITLFEDGLVASPANSAQPMLSEHLLRKVEHHWSAQEVTNRTQAAIQHVAQFIPSFATARVGSKPLYGAQQIPGSDPGLRAADVSFCCDGYARAEIVKASSALAASDAILEDLQRLGLITERHPNGQSQAHYFPITQSISNPQITELAIQLAEQRDYISALAKPVRAFH